MNPRIHITHFRSPGQKLCIRQRSDFMLSCTDWTGAEREITQEEANAIALAVLDGSGVPEFSRSEASV